MQFPLLTSQSYESIISNEVFWQEIDKMQDDMQQTFEEEQAIILLVGNLTSGTSLMLATGVSAWLLRSGALLASLLSALPAWTSVDPLSVLTANDKEKVKKKPKDSDETNKNSTEAADELFSQNYSGKLS